MLNNIVYLIVIYIIYNMILLFLEVGYYIV